MDDLAQKLKRFLIKLTLFFFKGFILVKQILGFFWRLVKRICFFIFSLISKFGGKELILALYKVYFYFKRGIAKIFLPAKNKYLYPFINKETLHLIIILLTVIICAENIRLKLNRAQSFEGLIGTKSVLAMFATEELEDTILIEEKISAEDLRKGKNLAVITHGLSKTDQVDLEEEEGQEARTLTQSGGILKPDIMGTGEEAIEEPGQRKGTVEYVVQAGDVLGSIAAKFSISVNTILWANNLNFNSFIRPGDKLRILPVTGVLHVVSSGETLLSIASKYKVDIGKIQQYNNLASADRLKKGQELLIPEGIKPAAPRQTILAQKPAASSYSLKQIFAPDKSIYSTNSKFIWPTAHRRITQYYHLGHSAIDIGDKTGTPIYSIEKGQIILSGWSRGYGNNIIVDHGGGQKSRYAHFSKLYVKKGDFVGKGQQIGEMGSTGNSTGPHLHIEIIINSRKVNPLSYLK